MKRPSKRGYHHGDLRRALVEAALVAIEELGPEGFNLRDIARRVGVAASAPYRHFADKDALLAAVAAECSERLGAAMDAAVAAAEDPLDRFRQTGIAYVRFAVENPAHFRVMSMPGVARKGPLRGDVDAWMAEEVARLRQAQRDGFLVDMPVEPILLAARAMTYGLARLIVDDQDGLGQVGAQKAAELAMAVTHVLGIGLVPRPLAKPLEKKPPGKEPSGRKPRA